MANEQLASAKGSLISCVNAEKYLAAVKEFDELWASTKSPLNQARMNDLIMVIRIFEARFPDK